MKKIPKIADQRIGQRIFNFLEWLKEEKGVNGNQNKRMADPYYLSDDEWESYWVKWCNKLAKQK